MKKKTNQKDEPKRSRGTIGESQIPVAAKQDTK